MNINKEAYKFFARKSGHLTISQISKSIKHNAEARANRIVARVKMLPQFKSYRVINGQFYSI